MSEGAGENMFVVKDGVLLTPDLAHSVLGGITRDTVMKLARELGLEVRETAIPRELLYLADELFFTGTAVEITPIRSVDRITGRRRPPRADHRAAAAGVLRTVLRRHAGSLGLARLRRHAAQARAAAAAR